MKDKDVAQILRDKGLRVTPQRIAIYECLAGTTAHPTAETVYQQLHSKYPSMSLNTVYKTLLVLEAAGLIQRFTTADSVFRYDANPAEHVHAVCLKCGRVSDVPGDFGEELERLRAKAVGNSDYNIRYSTLLVYGLCPECKR
ncbi:MAG TPA: transcriptional repressor [Firmicutes bacterium]|nr:transcriptional repressor [Bacillota bacterium]